MRVMKTQEQIREEIDRLLEEDRLEEAEVLAERLIPISTEEFLKRLDEAPLDDEPVTAEQRAALDRPADRRPAGRRQLDSAHGRDGCPPSVAGVPAGPLCDLVPDSRDDWHPGIHAGGPAGLKKWLETGKKPAAG